MITFSQAQPEKPGNHGHDAYSIVLSPESEYLSELKSFMDLITRASRQG